MNLAERIRRWWNPAQWRDEHPVISEGGEGHPLSDEERAEDRRITGGIRLPETSTDYADET